ncbi:hypothetical protein NIES4103_27540 [Nostoc sp. NIES-4103]|nr:hypothetical protein NIES4103_27540 [Nostoc sp. NIES-4103]
MPNAQCPTPKPCRDSSLQALSEYQRPARERQLTTHNSQLTTDMNQTNTTDLTQDLQALEAHLERVIQSPAFTHLMGSGFCNPDFTLPDALMAVQQALSSYNEMMSVIEQYAPEYKQDFRPHVAPNNTYSTERKINFLHIKHDPALETALRMEYIACTQRLGNDVFVHFAAGNNPLHLCGQAAEIFWHFVKVNSVTVFSPPPSTAAPEVKSAETQCPQGNSASASE